MNPHLLAAVLLALPLAAQDQKPVPAVRAVELRITDDKGGPIQTATVQLFQAAKGQPRYRVVAGQAPRQLAPKDFTGDHAQLTDLPAGSFVLRVDAELHALAFTEIFELPAERAPRLLVKLSRGTTVEGVVTRPDGKPLADAEVHTEDAALAANRHPFLQMLQTMFASTTTATQGRTDAEGRYRLDHLAPGDYCIVASHFAFAPASQALKVGEAAKVKLPALALPEGAQVVGTVTRGGKPVAGAEVVFTSMVDTPSTNKLDVVEVHHSVLTDAAGKFRLPARVPLGKRYSISASDETTPLGKAGQMTATKRPVVVKAGMQEQVENVALPKQ